uniref:Uncharacterized protein n=1 Tax=Romanomermis culicivorax TaxID=13658 RepID=A0A915I091_ROMCU
MVVMALVTTFMTSPLLSIVYPSKYHNVLGGQRNVIERLSVVSSTARLRRRQKGKITTIPEEAPNGTRDAVTFHEPLRLLLFLDDDLNILLLLARLTSLFKADEEQDCRE